MPEWLPLFLAGLLGGAHCVGMCGGLVGAFAGVQAPGAGGRQAPALRLHFAFNGGRIASYAIAGALAGALGMAGVGLATQLPLRLVLMGLASAMLAGMAFYLMGLPQLLLPLERAGALVWRRLQPLSRRWLPVKGADQALALGLLWGWLPCGLVYSALATALASGSPARGGAAMLAFGLGTLPNLLAAGLAAARLRALVARRGWRIAAGLVILAFAMHGFWSLARIAAATQ
jgi:sulfite exporter TauE/SafE